MDETFEIKLTATDLYTIFKMADGCFTICKNAVDSNSRDEVQDNVGSFMDNIISLVEKLKSQLNEGEK